MACDAGILKQVPLFALLDDDEIAVLAAQVEITTFAQRQRIYRIGDAAERAYVMVSGAVQVTTIDEDHQDVVVAEPSYGEFFGFASMLKTPHQTDAVARTTVCIEVDRNDIMVLLRQKPTREWTCSACSGDNFTTQQLVRTRAARNERMIEKEATVGERMRTRGRIRRIVDFHHHFLMMLCITCGEPRATGLGLGSVSLHPPQPVLSMLAALRRRSS